MGIGLELHRTGTVEYVPIGDGFYGIVCDTIDGYKNLYPISLPSEYQVDGTRISFVATTREDYYAVLSNDILQWGVPIETISISKVGEVPPGEEVPEEGIPGVPVKYAPTEWFKNPWLWAGIGGLVLLSGGFGRKVRKKK